MGKIFAGQSALRITVKTYTELEGVSEAVIKYRKPDGSNGSFPAAILDVANGVIFHECLEGEINKRGWWLFWAFVRFEDGRSTAGEAARVFVWREGS